MSATKDVPQLTELYYSSWEFEMTACFHQLGVVCHINASFAACQQLLIENPEKDNGKQDPLSSSQLTMNAQIEMKNAEALDCFEMNKEKAAGKIFAHLSVSQQTHVKGKEDNSAAMWLALSTVHSQQVPGMQFTAYNNLFNIVKDTNKSLPSVAGCVMEALSEIVVLCPSAFTINNLDEELALMAMLCSLPHDQYAEFVNGLMCMPLLTLATVQALFQTEQAEAQFIASAPCTSPKALSAIADTKKPICLFCGIANHTQERCFRFLNAQKQAKASVADCKQHNKPNNTRKASDNSANASSSSNGQAAAAYSASLCLASSLHTKADMFWIADMGTTSHMSLHCKWFVEYCPYCIPVHVANDAIVYSAGIGDVVLTPTDPSMNPCCLTCVLYIPELQNNLLSILHLVTVKVYGSGTLYTHTWADNTMSKRLKALMWPAQQLYILRSTKMRHT
jgi:hypothetical protein